MDEQSWGQVWIACGPLVVTWITDFVRLKKKAFWDKLTPFSRLLVPSALSGIWGGMYAGYYAHSTGNFSILGALNVAGIAALGIVIRQMKKKREETKKIKSGEVIR